MSCTRKVLLQCPQDMRAPDGWGSELTGPGCTGPRLIILLLHTDRDASSQHSLYKRYETVSAPDGGTSGRISSQSSYHRSGLQAASSPSLRYSSINIVCFSQLD